MGFYRVMFVGHGPSGLPADRIVNTFHFSTGATGQDLNDSMMAVQDFYTAPGTSPAPASALGSYLSPWVQRDAEVRGYNMDDVKPRVPNIATFTLPVVTNPSGAPEEVALCLSFHGTPPPAVTPRTRGRLYFGPLTMDAIDVATAAAPARPDAQFVALLKNRAEALAGNGHGWAVRSEVTNTYTLITQGFIDDAFDTQRRRGPDATSRVLFGP